METEFDDFERRLWFISQVVPPDDLHEFVDILLQMNFMFASALSEFTNLDTIFEMYPEVEKGIKNLIEFRLRMRHKDTRVVDLQKFDLSS